MWVSNVECLATLHMQARKGKSGTWKKTTEIALEIIQISGKNKCAGVSF